MRSSLKNVQPSGRQAARSSPLDSDCPLPGPSQSARYSRKKTVLPVAPLYRSWMGESSSRIQKYPLSADEQSCIHASFPQCLWGASPLGVRRDCIAESASLAEYSGVLLTFRESGNLYYLKPLPLEDPFVQFSCALKFGQLYPLFAPPFRSHFTHLQGFLSNGVSQLFAIENGSQLVCLEDAFKLPRPHSGFARGVLFECPGLLDFEARVLPYDDSFRFLLGTRSEITLLAYRRGKASPLVRLAIRDGLSLVYVFSLTEIIAKGPTELHRLSLKQGALTDQGPLPFADRLLDLTWKPSRKDILKSLIKGPSYLIMLCSHEDSEDTLLVMDSEYKKLGETAVPKLYVLPEIRHFKQDQAIVVLYANRVLYRFTANAEVQTTGILLDDSLILQRLSSVQTRRALLLAGETETGLPYAWRRVRPQPPSSGLVLSFAAIHQLHEAVDLRRLGVEDMVQLYFGGSKILLLHQSSACSFYSAQMEDGRELLLLLNRQTHHFHQVEAARLLHDGDHRSPFPLALLLWAAPQKVKALRRSVTMRVVSMTQESADTAGAGLELWTGENSLTPVSSEAEAAIRQEGASLLFLLPALVSAQSFQGLSVVQLCDPCCAVLVDTETWRIVGNQGLARLLQNRHKPKHFLFVKFVEGELRGKAFEWGEGRPLPGTKTCQNMLSVNSQHYLFVGPPQQLQSVQIEVHDPSVSLLHLESLKMQKILCRLGQVSQIATNGEGGAVFRCGQTSRGLFWVPFQYPIDSDFSLVLADAEYTFEAGSSGALLLGDYNESILHLPASLEDLVQNMPYFLSRELCGEGGTGGGGVEEVYRRALQRVRGQGVETFYLRVGNCEENRLLLSLLHWFPSLAKMDERFGIRRFTASLAKHFVAKEAQGLLWIFAKDLGRLVEEAELANLSLRAFFEASTVKVGEGRKVRAFEGEEWQSSAAGSGPQAEIYRSRFKMPASASRETILVARGLFATNELDVFDSGVIGHWVELRWREARTFFMAEAVVLVLSMTSLGVFSAVSRDIWLLVPLVVLQLWTATVEVIEFDFERRRYFLDFWNWFDSLRLIFTLLYFGIDATNSFSPHQESTVLTFLNLVYAFKAFSLFALNKNTRVLLRGIIEIVKDSTPFLILCAAATFLFALLFTSALPSPSLNPDSYIYYLFHSFLLGHGDFSPDRYNPVQVFIFVLASLFGPLLMLNTVIAIMSDSYDRIKSDQGPRDLQELAGLVYKYKIVERRLCGRRGPAPTQFLFFSRQHIRSAKDTSWVGRVKTISSQISSLEKSVLGSINKLEKRMDALETKIESMQTIKSQIEGMLGDRGEADS